VQFIVVYIREAHALGDAMHAGSMEIPGVEVPQTYGERQDVAQACSAHVDFGGMQVLVDSIDDAVEKAYWAYPDRLYLVGKDGMIAYHGLQGPNGMRPEELREAIEEELELMD